MCLFALLTREAVSAVGKGSVEGPFSQELPSQFGEAKDKTRDRDIVWRLDGDFVRSELGEALTLGLIGRNLHR